MRICVGYNPDGSKKWDDLGASEAPYLHARKTHIGGTPIVATSMAQPYTDRRIRSEAAKAAWARRKAGVA